MNATTMKIPSIREQLHLLPTDLTKAKVRAASIVGYSITQCARFVLSSKRDERLIYHSGDLATDSTTDARVRDKTAYINLTAQLGLVGLRQERVGEHWSNYVAVRSDMPIKAAPSRVLHLDLTVEQWRALHAMVERQAHVSVQRAMRSALQCSNEHAAELLRNMIRDGWISHGRPPELTDLGRAMLA